MFQEIEVTLCLVFQTSKAKGIKRSVACADFGAVAPASKKHKKDKKGPKRGDDVMFKELQPDSNGNSRRSLSARG